MKKQNEFNFCPICRSDNISYLDNRKWKCAECGYTLYNNVACAVGIILYDDEDNILLEVRAKQPRKGFLALPGGFCDQDETAEHAVIRECQEETGFTPKQATYLCSFPNNYEYKGVLYKTCDLFFTAKLGSNDKNETDQTASIEKLIKSLHNQKSEVSSFVACKVKSQSDVDSLPLAFESAKKTLSLWLKRKSNQ